MKLKEKRGMMIHNSLILLLSIIGVYYYTISLPKVGEQFKFFFLLGDLTLIFMIYRSISLFPRNEVNRVVKYSKVKVVGKRKKFHF